MPARTQIYVGNLDREISRRELENTFDKYGKVLSCDIKSKGNAPSYAFIDFEDERDAEDALRLENGKELRGRSMVIEFAKTKDEKISRESRYGRNGFSRGGRGGERTLDCYECGRRGHFAKNCPDRDRRRDRDRRDRDRDDRRDRRRSRSRSRRRTRSGSRRRSRTRSDSRRRSRSRSNQRRASRTRSRS